MAKHKRAPRGYRIERWIDGAYHVYNCLVAGWKLCVLETQIKQEAIDTAWEDKSRYTTSHPQPEDK